MSIAYILHSRVLTKAFIHANILVWLLYEKVETHTRSSATRYLNEQSRAHTPLQEITILMSVWNMLWWLEQDSLHKQIKSNERKCNIFLEPFQGFIFFFLLFFSFSFYQTTSCKINSCNNSINCSVSFAQIITIFFNVNFHASNFRQRLNVFLFLRLDTSGITKEMLSNGRWLLVYIMQRIRCVL